MTVAPLTSLECELLESVVREDDGALAVLADYWIENVDAERGAFVMLDLGDNAARIELADEEARLSRHAQRWRQPFLQHGFHEHDLILANGFLQYPISIAADHDLDGRPELVRISPRYFRERAPALRHGVECSVYDAEVITPRTTTRAIVKAPREPELVELLEHEQSILARLAHPNIVRSYGWVIRPGGVRGLALEWAGIDLRRLLGLARRHGRLLGDDFALSVGVQLADALVAIHAAGAWHGEIRSDHVAITSDGVVRVIDFGCARAPWHRYRRYERYVSPGYPGDNTYRFRALSPEQVIAQAVDERTDVFSAAGLIAELAGNAHPFTGITEFEILLAIRDANVQLPALAAPLRFALASSFARVASDRATAADLKAALERAARIMRLPIGPHVIAQRLVELGVPA